MKLRLTLAQEKMLRRLYENGGRALVDGRSEPSLEVLGNAFRAVEDSIREHEKMDPAAILTRLCVEIANYAEMAACERNAMKSPALERMFASRLDGLLMALAVADRALTEVLRERAEQLVFYEWRRQIMRPR